MATRPRRRGHKPDALYFTGLAIVRTEHTAITGSFYRFEDSTVRRTAVLSVRNGQWGSYAIVSGIVHAIRFTEDPEWQLLVLARAHGLYRITVNGTAFEEIGKGDEGFLMDLRPIAGRWYAVGGHHQVYREDAGSWHHFDDGIRVMGEAGQAKVLLSIDGVAEDDIYTVGFNGAILHYDGRNWTALDSPTNIGLQRVLCVSRDEVYICGYAGSLYRGNLRGWTALAAPSEGADFWDMARFQGRIYVCTKHRLYVLNGDNLAEVEIPVAGPLGFYRLDASQTELWTCGNECALRFDGNTWVQYVWPENT